MTRLGQEHNGQALTDPDLIAHLVVSHIARQSSAASTLGFSSHRWSRQCVICTPQSPLYASYAWGSACCIPHCRTCRLETNCFASRSSTRVDSSESFVLCKAILTSDVTSVIVHPKTALHRGVQPLVFGSVVSMHSHILNSRTKCCHSARLDCASFILPVDLAITFPTTSNVTRRRAQRFQYPCPIRIHWCGIAPVCHAPLSVRLVHRFPFMRFTRYHLRLVSMLSVDRRSLWTHLRFQLMQCSHRLSQRRPILLISKLTAAA